MKKIFITLLLCGAFVLGGCSKYTKTEIYECTLTGDEMAKDYLFSIQFELSRQGILTGEDSRQKITGEGLSYDAATKDSDKKAAAQFHIWANSINIFTQEFPQFKGTFNYALIRYNREIGDDGNNTYEIIETKSFTRK